VTRPRARTGPAPTTRRPLWTCPRCGAPFLVRNSSHSCGRFHLDDLFSRAEPHVRAIFDRFDRLVREAGESTLIPQKSRAVFTTRMRFINVQVRRSHLLVAFVLARRPASGRFSKIETMSPGTHVGYLPIRTDAEMDADVRRWIREAYAVGMRR
jgi:hypothetical protein